MDILRKRVEAAVEALEGVAEVDLEVEEEKGRRSLKRVLSLILVLLSLGLLF